jgi:hypothetical protein
MAMPPIPSITGGASSARSGDQITGAASFGAFNYTPRPQYGLYVALAVAGAVAIAFILKK